MALCKVAATEEAKLQAVQWFVRGCSIQAAPKAAMSPARLKPEWRDLLADLDRLQEIKAEQGGKRFILRTPVSGVAGKVFQAIGISLPPNIREAEAASIPA